MSGEPWKVDFPKYKSGFGPIDIKVVDPLNVPGGNFNLKFVDTVLAGETQTKTYWIMQALDNQVSPSVVFSEKPVGEGSEQLIAEWGLSVNIDTVVHPGEDSEVNQENPLYRAGLISARVEYADSSRQWLTGISDVDGVGPENWIRAGKINEEPDEETNPNADDFNDIFNDRRNPNATGTGQTSVYSGPETRIRPMRHCLMEEPGWLPFALSAYGVPGVIFHAPSHREIWEEWKPREPW